MGGCGWHAAVHLQLDADLTYLGLWAATLGCSGCNVGEVWGCVILFWGVLGPAAGAGVPSRTAGTPWGRGLIQAWHVDVESAGCSLSAATRSISTSHGWLVPSASDSWLMVVAFGRGARLPRGGACFVGCVRPARASCSRGVCSCGVGCSGQAGVPWLPAPMAACLHLWLVTRQA